MIIKELIIDYNTSFPISIKFKNKNLIFSKDNSKGKTTLIRFLLYALGFKIPSTARINMDEHGLLLNIELANNNYSCERNNNEYKIICPDKTILSYNLLQEDERLNLMSFIFGINNIKLLNNILGVFYIDQEKGWTLLNYGKAIGNNHFNVDEFLASIIFKDNNVDITMIDSKIEEITSSIKKYKVLLKLMRLDYDLNETKDSFLDKNYDNLITEKADKLFEKQLINQELENVESLYNNNKTFEDIINSYNLIIRHENLEFILKSEDICDFNINQNILNSKISLYKIKLEKIDKEIKAIDYKIDEYNRLINIDDVSSTILNQIKNSNISAPKLDTIISQLNKERLELINNKKQMIDICNDVTNYLSESIKKISTDLDVFKYIKEEKNYIFTTNLKQFSGAVLHKIVLSYKLSYYLTLKKYYDICIPFIIDSPGSGELTEDNVKIIIDISKKYLGDSQLIVASIFDNIMEDFDKIIEISNGIFDKSSY